MIKAIITAVCGTLSISGLVAAAAECQSLENQLILSAFGVLAFAVGLLGISITHGEI